MESGAFRLAACRALKGRARLAASRPSGIVRFRPPMRDQVAVPAVPADPAEPADPARGRWSGGVHFLPPVREQVADPAAARHPASTPTRLHGTFMYRRAVR